MSQVKVPSREQQIALMAGAQERMSQHARKWLTVPAVKAMLHRYDNKQTGCHSPKRVGAR